MPHVKLSGPTSFAPIIYEAMRVVQESGGLFHILVILADGVITRSSALGRGQWSVQERESMEAIVAASKLPLSIIVVGVGDGPWDQMENFDDGLPDRDFDNLQVGCRFLSKPALPGGGRLALSTWLLLCLLPPAPRHRGTWPDPLSCSS